MMKTTYYCDRCGRENPDIIPNTKSQTVCCTRPDNQNRSWGKRVKKTFVLRFPIKWIGFWKVTTKKEV